MTLKETDRDLSKYPINIEVTSVVSLEGTITLPIGVQSNEWVFSLEDMSSDICGAVVEPSCDNFEDEVTVVSIADASDVEKGRVFLNKQVMKLIMSFYAIQNMFEYVVVYSDKKDYLVKCSCDECGWICRASKLAKTEMFKIMLVAEAHTCASNIVLGSHRQVTKLVVSSCIRYKFTLSRTTYTPNDIRNDMMHIYGVSLDYVKAWRSREETLKMIKGDHIESFSKIPEFFYMLSQTNPGTVTRIENDGRSRVKYCFMALSVVAGSQCRIRGCEHCRHVVVVDNFPLLT